LGIADAQHALAAIEQLGSLLKFSNVGRDGGDLFLVFGLVVLLR